MLSWDSECWTNSPNALAANIHSCSTITTTANYFSICIISSQAYKKRKQHGIDLRK